MTRLLDHVDALRNPPAVAWPFVRQWAADWNTQPGLAGRLDAWIRLARPQVIVETGTFEAIGTAVMARALAAVGGGKILTFDCDEPFETDELRNLSIPPDEFRRLADIRRRNLADVSARFPQVEVTYFSGDTRETLRLVPDGVRCDFWYQDSMHFLTGIRGELAAMERLLDSGSVVAFDDVDGTNLLLTEWIPHEASTGWDHHHFADGHGQLWSQKR